MRSAFDFAPFRRSTVGFDRLFDMLENNTVGQTQENYPPFDLIKVGENEYRIELAVAGFKPDELDITAQQNVLAAVRARSDEGLPRPRPLMMTKDGARVRLYSGRSFVVIAAR